MYRIDTIDNRAAYWALRNYNEWSAYEVDPVETEAVTDLWGFLKGLFSRGAA